MTSGERDPCEPKSCTPIDATTRPPRRARDDDDERDAPSSADGAVGGDATSAAVRAGMETKPCVTGMPRRVATTAKVAFILLQPNFLGMTR